MTGEALLVLFLVCNGANTPAAEVKWPICSLVINSCGAGLIVLSVVTGLIAEVLLKVVLFLLLRTILKTKQNGHFVMAESIYFVQLLLRLCRDQ